MQVRFGEFTLDTESRLLLERLRQAWRCHGSRRVGELHERQPPFVSTHPFQPGAEAVPLWEKQQARFCGPFSVRLYETPTDVTVLTPSSDQRPRCCVIWKWGQVRLGEGEHLLGRAADVAVWLESPSVSRHHARLRVSGPDMAIEDLGSKNGTYLRGKRVRKPSPVADGDDIELGSILVTIRVFDTSGSTESRHSRQRGRRSR
jgi:hypothetical protein